MAVKEDFRLRISGVSALTFPGKLSGIIRQTIGVRTIMRVERKAHKHDSCFFNPISLEIKTHAHTYSTDVTTPRRKQTVVCVGVCISYLTLAQISQYRSNFLRRSVDNFRLIDMRRSLTHYTLLASCTSLLK